MTKPWILVHYADNPYADDRPRRVTGVDYFGDDVLAVTHAHMMDKSSTAVMQLDRVYDHPIGNSVRQETLLKDMKELIEDFHHRWDKDDDKDAPELGQRLRDIYWRMRQ